MTEPTWADWQLFGDERAYHQCCECCDCCPFDGVEREHILPDGDSLWRVKINDRTYVTNRYLAILEDRVRVECGNPVDGPKPATWAIPAERPPLTTTFLAAHCVHWLTSCGLTVHEGDGPLERQHVYADAEHIGWLMPVKEVTPSGATPLRMRWADIDRVRTLAENLPLPVSMDPWDAAASLINAIPTITGTREKAATP